MSYQLHNIPPVFNENSKILILGSFPSSKSRQDKFFYAHRQNRFWKVLSYILNQETPISTEQKTLFLLKNNIALWDVIKSCDIDASSDLSIKNAILNDFDLIFKSADIKAVFLNGKTAYNLFIKNYACDKKTIYLPSTIPANAAFNF